MLISEMVDDELLSLLGACSRDLVRARFVMKMNRGGNAGIARKLRKQIARVRTELRRRDLVGGVSKLVFGRAALHGPQSDPMKTAEGFLVGVVDGLGSAE